MVRTSVLGGIIDFFDRLGVFEVILPFLLVFTIVFAMLEKSQVFGTEKVGGETIPKKNLNAMAAFAIAFFVVASSRIVEVLTAVSSQIVVLIMLAFFWILLVGVVFKGEDAGFFKDAGWKTGFIFVTLIAIVMVFLNAIKTASGQTWLEVGWRFLVQNWNSAAVASIILIVGIIFFIKWVTAKPA